MKATSDGGGQSLQTATSLVADAKAAWQGHNGWNAFRSMFAHFGFPEQVIGEITEHLTTVTLDKDARIFAQGASADIVFALLSGWAKTYLLGRDRRILVQIVGAGEFVGYGNYSTENLGAKQIFEARAASRCSIAMLTGEHFRRALRKLDPAAMLRLVAIFTNRQSGVAARFATLLAVPFRVRLELVLHELGERFGVRDTRGIILRPEVKHQDLADMIGSSRPMVTRLLLQLVDDGIVTRVGRNLVLLSESGNGAETD